MVRADGHDGKHLIYRLIRQGLMEQVGHGIHEHQSRLAPAQGISQALGDQANFSGPVGRAVLNYGQASVDLADLPVRTASEAVSIPDGIAVLAPGADLGAANYRVPSLLSP